ncbi:unnamed protein product [Clonostachys rosea f. rosea IK726]|jgi:hypothetical protein|uniref:Uncharacterized protein n=1 Tax=Clonostachys rosea f. rosea IK726 TaxID=1349383 RepID=A0ACA9TSX7_BIOOC|nr:unnamed protein product [Clonostachys rosea f. rosea IK726]
MASKHPLAIDSPGWHGEAKTPVIDGKYIDRKTGKICLAGPHDQEFLGPPAVDIVINSIYSDDTPQVFHAQRSFPMEALLYQIMKVAKERKIALDSVTATPYAIRVILGQTEISKESFVEASLEMVNGIFDDV